MEIRKWGNTEEGGGKLNVVGVRQETGETRWEMKGSKTDAFPHTPLPSRHLFLEKERQKINCSGFLLMVNILKM